MALNFSAQSSAANLAKPQQLQQMQPAYQTSSPQEQRYMTCLMTPQETHQMLAQLTRQTQP